MIPVAPVPEPPGFDERARKPGMAWLAENPAAPRPRDLWSPFRGVLAEGFAHRCGYTAMFIPDGTIDHHLSYRTNPELSYAWSNYRYVAGWINSSKKTAVVLDPYVVGKGWFEVLLPSMQLVVTKALPPEHRALAEQTLKILPIAHDERALRQRRRWYEMYQSGKLSLAARRGPLDRRGRGEAARRRHAAPIATLERCLARPRDVAHGSTSAVGRA